MQITGRRAGCRGQGCAGWRQRRAVLSGDRGRAAPGRRRCRSPATDRAARGQGRAGWRPRRAVLSGHRGRAVPRSKVMQGSGSRSGCPWSRVCRMAPASGRAQWRSRASGARSKAMQVTSSRSGGSSWSRSRKAPTRRTGYQRRAVLGGDRGRAAPGRRRCRAAAGDRVARGQGCPDWRQPRAVLSGHRHQANAIQISVAIAGERCQGRRRCRAAAGDRVARGQGCAGWRSLRAVLNRRPISRFCVVSIEEGSRKANRLPASGRDRWPSAPGEGDADLSGHRGRAVPRRTRCRSPAADRVCPWSRVCRMAPASGRAQWRSRASAAKVEGDAGQRQAIGLPVVKGVSDGARFGPCSIVARSGGSSWSRLRKAPTRRTGYQRRAVLGGHRHQANAMQITGSRSGCPWSRVCRLAPASGRARWRSRASGARSNAMQITGSRSGCPWSRVCRLAPASGRARWPSAPGERDSDLSGHRGRAVARSKAMQGSGRRSGCPWSRVSRLAPASGRAQWPSRASGAKVEGDAGQRQAIGLPVVKSVPTGASVGPCSIVARSGGSSWSRLRKAPARRTGCQRRAVLVGHRRQAKAMQITGSRSGCPWSRVCRLAPASGRAQWPSAPGERDSDLSGHRGRAVPRRTRCRSPAADRVARGQECAGWRPRRAVLSGDRGQALPRSKAMQGSGRRSGCPWSRACRMAPASGRAQSSPDQPVLRGLD
jgi:signal recognition particle subunit SEC65